MSLSNESMPMESKKVENRMLGNTPNLNQEGIFSLCFLIANFKMPFGMKTTLFILLAKLHYTKETMVNN